MLSKTVLKIRTPCTYRQVFEFFATDRIFPFWSPPQLMQQIYKLEKCSFNGFGIVIFSSTYNICSQILHHFWTIHVSQWVVTHELTGRGLKLLSRVLTFCQTLFCYVVSGVVVYETCLPALRYILTWDMLHFFRSTQNMWAEQWLNKWWYHLPNFMYLKLGVCTSYCSKMLSSLPSWPF